MVKTSTKPVECWVNILDIESDNVWCLCCQGDNGKFMIQCDLCDEWYHGKCVKVTSKLAETWSKYHCPHVKPRIYFSLELCSKGAMIA